MDSRASDTLSIVESLAESLLGAEEGEEQTKDFDAPPISWTMVKRNVGTSTASTCTTWNSVLLLVMTLCLLVESSICMCGWLVAEHVHITTCLKNCMMSSLLGFSRNKKYFSCIWHTSCR